ncbi:MAG: rod shape-determining protein MreD [Acidimicrobiales bacterium]
MSSVARIALLIITVLLAQFALAPHLRIAGISPDLLLLVALAGGMVGGSERGAAIGFAAGFGMDLLVTTPFGLWALTGCLAGWAVGQLHGKFLYAGGFLRFISAVGASAAALLLFIALALLMGQDFLYELPLARIVLVVSSVNGLLTPLAVRAMRWALVDSLEMQVARA